MKYSLDPVTNNKVFHTTDYGDSLQSSKKRNDLSPRNDLFAKTWVFFVVGRFLGIIPFSGVFRKSYLHLSFRPLSFPAVVSLGIISLLVINLVLEIMQMTQMAKRNAVEIAMAVKAPIFYGYGLFLYLYFYLQATPIIDLFSSWAVSKTFYSSVDITLSKDVFLACMVVLTSAFLENAVLHLKYLQRFDDLNDVVLLGYRKHVGVSVTNTDSSFLEVYYRRSHYDWTNILGYNEVYAVLVFVANKWTLYSWNYVDLFLGLCGRAIYFKFRSLYDTTKKKLTPSRKGYASVETASEQWLQIVKDHEVLCDLVDEFERILSPLIFMSYVINVFYICIQIYMGLHSEDSGPKSIIHSIYAPWSLMHLALRLYIVSISLARVNVYAHKIMDVLIECPIEYYHTNISRLVSRIATGPKIGFTGLGCFTVTKPFILKIISVVFTFEIVLLQGSSGVGASPKSSC